MAGLDDILSAQKNGVVGINNLATTWAKYYNYLKGAALSGGAAGTGTFAVLYTVPAGQSTTITDIEICNTGAAPATFYIALVPAGGTANASTSMFYNAPIPPYTTVQWTGNQVLGTGGTVQGYASTSAVTIKVSGAPGQ